MTNNYLFEMIRKIIFTNYFSEFIQASRHKIQDLKALQKKCFQSDIIFRHYVKMPPIKFRECLTKFMVSISLSEKFCCQNLITSIKYEVEHVDFEQTGLIHELNTFFTDFLCCTLN